MLNEIDKLLSKANKNEIDSHDKNLVMSLLTDAIKLIKTIKSPECTKSVSYIERAKEIISKF